MCTMKTTECATEVTEKPKKIPNSDNQFRPPYIPSTLIISAVFKHRAFLKMGYLDTTKQLFQLIR